MSVLRAIGGAWLGVHAPAAPAAMLRWLLERGLRGIVAGAGPRAIDWVAVAHAAESLPVTFPALRVGSILAASATRPEAALASANEGDRAAAMAAVAATVALGRRIGANVLILEPGVVRVPGEAGPTDIGDRSVAWTGELARAWWVRRNAVRDRALDVVCRTLHQLARTHPDVHLCLTPSRDILGLGEPEALAAIFEDLPGIPLGYWHDAAIAARRMELLGTPQGEWLAPFADRVLGVTVGDCLEGGLYALPGSGSVDFGLLASYRVRRGRPLPVALELDPGVEPAELAGARSFLSKFGL